MTTIAWDGYTLAADSLCVGGGGLPRAVSKIRRCGRFLYGVSGALYACTAVARWLSLDSTTPESEGPSLNDDGPFGLAVDSNGCAYVLEGSPVVMLPIRELFWASGSGRDFAIAAMALGKSAIEAVAFAARFDVYTGGEIHGEAGWGRPQ